MRDATRVWRATDEALNDNYNAWRCVDDACQGGPTRSVIRSATICVKIQYFGL